MSRVFVERPFWLRHYLEDVVLRCCALFTVAFALMPPHGLGVELCLCQRMTGAPCPVCGMTRSGSNLVRGEVVRAAQYHPFGPLLLPLIAGLGLLALAPRRWRRAVRIALMERAEPVRPVYNAIVAALIVYGVVRWILVFGGWCGFPAGGP